MNKKIRISQSIKFLIVTLLSIILVATSCNKMNGTDSSFEISQSSESESLTSEDQSSIIDPAEYSSYYVDPENGDDNNSGLSTENAFLTLKKARDTIRTISHEMQQNIAVILRGGTYVLDESFVLTQLDSGKNGYEIIYTAYNDETPILSGGKNISGGWTLHNESLNIYKREGITGDFRQIYVNESWAVRARTPNVEHDATGGPYFPMKNYTYPYEIDASHIGSWARNANTEFVMISHWSNQRGRIQDYSVSGDIATISFKMPEANFAFDHHTQQQGHFYIENAYELLDAPNEWFHDKKSNTLYYIPEEDADINNLEIIIPNIEKIISFEGNSNNPVENITIRGLGLKNNNWTEPDLYGYVSVQGGHTYQISSSSTDNKDIGAGIFAPATGAITLKNSKNIKIEECNISLGGSWGIMQQEIGTDNKYIGNHISYLALGGIAVGNSNNSTGFWSLPAGTAENTIIENNLIENVGYYYMDTPGILALKVKNVKIHNNEVRNLPYSGISMGFDWVDQNLQQSSNNSIMNNRVHNVMRLLDDGGGIYVLGQQPGGIMSENYVSLINPSVYSAGYPIASYYFDNGSSLWTFSKNVSDHKGWFLYSRNQPNHSLTGRDNFYNSKQLGFADGFNDRGVWENNLKVESNSWPQAAVLIMQNSGIQSQYGNIGTITCGAISVTGTEPGQFSLR